LSEYPWALQHLGEKDSRSILDIGSDPLFALLVYYFLGWGKDARKFVEHRAWTDAGKVGCASLYQAGLFFSLRDIWRKIPQWNTVIGLPEQLTFVKDESFDTITNISVMEHLSDEMIEDWFAFMARVLKPEGTILLTADWINGYDVGHDHSSADLRNFDFRDAIERSGLHLVDPNPTQIPWMEGYQAPPLASPGEIIVYGIKLQKS
jgi:SAM-dependent methyltransferase